LERHQHKKEIIDRLSRIEGHIRGIKKMLEEGRPCDEVLLQFSSVQAALSKAGNMLLEDHFDHCIMANIKDPEKEGELLSFKRALGQLMK
jgi:DNA-binding FrmR family transcriptional regulator